LPHNVVLIITDQQRRDACGCYGNPIVKTPALDRLAARGVRFTDAYCDSPLCAPSRAAMITGRRPFSNTALTHMINGLASGAPGNPGIVSEETLGTMFRKAGYATGAIGKMHVHGETRQEDLGFDVRKHRFYTYDYEDYVNEVGQERVDAYLCDKTASAHNKYNTSNTPVKLEARYMQDSLTTASSMEFIRANAGKPFFLHVGLEKPHPPWGTQAEFHAMYDPDKMPLPDSRREWDEKPPVFPFIPKRGLGPEGPGFTDDEMRRAVASYYACVSNADDNVGRILTLLDELNLTDDTIVIFTADHGDNLFDHGLMQKHCFYESAVGIPLIAAGPGLEAGGATCSQPCSLIDLMPTLTQLCSLPTPGDAEGASLVPAVAGEIDPDRAIFSEFHESSTGPCRMIRTQRWKYLLFPGKTEVLFDRQADPKELTNLATDPAHEQTCKDLRARTLDGWDVPGLP
jgi:choline-sulfatase